MVYLVFTIIQLAETTPKGDFMDWLTNPIVAVILAAALAFVGGLLSILVKELIRKIDSMDTKMSSFVSRDEMETKLERVRVDIDKQLIRQEDRITKRLDSMLHTLEELRVWLSSQIATKADKDDIPH